MARAVPVLSWSDDSRMPAKAHPRSAALSKTALEPRFRVGQGRSFACKRRIRWTACCPYENILRHGCCGLGCGCTGSVVGRAERLAAERGAGKAQRRPVLGTRARPHPALLRPSAWRPGSRPPRYRPHLRYPAPGGVRPHRFEDALAATAARWAQVDRDPQTLPHPFAYQGPHA